MVGRGLIHSSWRLFGTPGSYYVPGKGISVQIPHKKNMKRKSSTEEELIGVDDVIDKMIWSRYFI